MGKEVGASDQSTDLGAHLCPGYSYIWLPQSITQGKICACYTSLVKTFTIWNDEANFTEDLQIICMEVIM